MKFIFLALYAVGMLLISIYSSKKVKTLDDFYLGSRKIGPWMSAFAYTTTYFSAVIFIGYAGNIGWNTGIAAVLIGFGNALIGSYLAWKLLARRTRLMTHKLSASTMPEFFEARYGSKAMKIFSAIIIFIFLAPYSASVYQGLSYIFELVFGIPFIYAILGIAVLTAVFLWLGGYIATALTDVFQGVIMLVGIILMILFVVNAPQVGGLTEGLNRLAAIDPTLAQLPTGNGLWTLISLVLLTSLGSWGLPQMIHKFYAVKDDKAAKRGGLLSAVFALIIGGGAYFSGAFGRLFLNNQMPIDPTTGVGNPDMIMPQVIQAALPEALVGLIVILVLSASMSTLASLVLVSSSAISMDLVKGVLKPNMQMKTSLTLMRVLCIAFVGVSVVIALNRVNAIVTLMSFSWGALAGSFLAPYLYGLYWKRTSKAGAWAGLLSGSVVTLALSLTTGLSAPMIGVIAMVFSVIIVPVVSLLTPPLDPKLVDEAFSSLEEPKPEATAEPAVEAI